MMTFYLGTEIKEYQKKFKALKEKFMTAAGDSSNSAIFRHIIDILYKESQRREKKD